MAIIKEIRDRELYLWMNGKLVFKRWLDTGVSKVFDVMAYDKYTYASFTDRDLQETPGLIHVTAKLKLFSEKEGGKRKTGIVSGYRPNHVFEFENGKFKRTFIGDIQFENQQLIEPGEEEVVTVRFLANQPLEEYLNIGRIWWIYEGPNLIGELKMIDIEFAK